MRSESELLTPRPIGRQMSDLCSADLTFASALSALTVKLGFPAPEAVLLGGLKLSKAWRRQRGKEKKKNKVVGFDVSVCTVRGMVSKAKAP